MIGIEKVFSGRIYNIFALNVSGKCLVQDFIENLDEYEKKKILRLLTITADNGLYTNEEKFRKIKGEDLWEFKSDQVRIFCFFDKGKIIILSHGFIKKSPKTPRNQIEKAKRLLKDYYRWRERK
jgi:phage-related protein